VVDALWDLAWRGLITNDTFHPLRAFVAPPARTRRARQAQAFRSRRASPPAAQGRWSLVAERIGTRPSPTEWSTAVARQLLNRHGIVTRETVGAESLRGGFSAVYDVLKAMEEGGRVRRGLFVGGLAAAQFALPGALDLLRSLRDEPEVPQVVHLAATDPANPYGAILKWPDPTSETPREGRGPTRTVGASVVLVNGRLAAYLARGDRQLSVHLPEAEPARTITARSLATRLHALATAGDLRRGMLIAEIDGIPVSSHPMAPFLLEAGFVRGAMGLQAHRG
jgi:ATP-dependent Lhr-like helicase